jgi:hypothetical protein
MRVSAPTPSPEGLGTEGKPTNANESKRARMAAYLAHWGVITSLTVMIVAVCVLLWRFPPLRPFLAGFGAGAAAFLAPLPGLLTPAVRGKWLIAVGVASVIGLGTWYSSNTIEEERDSLARKVDQVGQRLRLQRGAFRGGPLALAIKKLPVSEQSMFLLDAANSLKMLYHDGRFDSVLNLAEIVGDLNTGNGHALYFEGEAYRSLGDRTNMRGQLQKYLQESDHRTDSLDGDAARCYQRPGGYCRERTAWIDHLLANDYYREALTSGSQIDREASSLGTAFNYEKHTLAIRPLGFYRLESIESSCELLHDLARELRRLGSNPSDVNLALDRYHRQFGPC